MAQLGHSSRTITGKHYTSIDMDVLRKVVEEASQSMIEAASRE
jgi:hypothetical protein